MPERCNGRPVMPTTEMGAFGTGEFEVLNKKPGEAWGGEKDANAAMAKLGRFTTEKESSLVSEGPVTLPTGPPPDRQPPG